MKRTLAVLFPILLGVLIGSWQHRARAVATYPALGASAPFVAPSAGSPGIPQQCGQDAGQCCFITFQAGSYLRIAARGGWGYNVSPNCFNPFYSILPNPGFPVLTDAGTAYSMANCALLTLADGGNVTSFDGGWVLGQDGGLPTCYPDGGGGYCDAGPNLGGPIAALPVWNPLSDGDVETLSLGNQQCTVYAQNFDGGVLTVSKRGL